MIVNQTAALVKFAPVCPVLGSYLFMNYNVLSQNAEENENGFFYLY